MENKPGIKQFVFMASFFFDGVLFDQLSKILLDSYLEKDITIIEGLLRIQIEHNPGIAFSIPLPYFTLIALNILIFGAIIVFLLRNLDLNKYLSVLTIAMLSAGAMGNLIDRIRLGYVIDFISVGSFPVFNLADSFITVAIFLLILFYDKIKRPT